MADNRAMIEQGAEFLSSVLEVLAYPIFVKDRQFRFVLVNRAMCELVSRTREELIGRTDYDFFPQKESDWFRAKDEEVFATGAQVTIEQESITDAKSGMHRLATVKVPLRDGSGTITHLVGIVHDISPLKAAEEALRRANEELERRVSERTAALAAAQEELVRKERLALLGQLAGGLAHQIRNPLASITNAGYLMQKALTGRNEPEVSRPLEIIVEEAWKANRIITGLLDQARERAPSRQPCRVARLVEEALASYPPPERVSVVRAIDDVPPVSADPNQVREALGNLVCNALDAMPTGGTLRVEARREGESVVIAVVDSGAGISPEQQSSLFRPLSTTKPHGLGLGLITARTLIENQGGKIVFVATPGQKGARFEVRLPLAAPPA